MRKIIFLYTFSIIGLFFYSFTQVDLGLALTRFPQLFSIQRSFQQIGYFNRPLSSLLYVLILILLFTSYLLLLSLIRNNKINRKQFWKLIILTTALLTFSYNAFSHDLFNYIFDAKIFTLYGENPYMHKALDFPGDPMLSFMRWTHRTYPYGPVWLVVTIPLSYLGFQIFILTFFLFKILTSISYVASVYLVWKIAGKIDSKYALLSAGFFAFNPLILVEGLVSSHLDIFMVFMALISLYFIIHKRYLLTLVFLALSIGIKFATVFLLPVFLAVLVLQYMKEKVPWNTVFLASLTCLGLSVLAASQKSGNFQPWYLLVLLPFSALLVRNKYIFWATSVMSFGTLFTYVPYLYLGHWDKPVPDLLNKLYIIVAIILISIVFFGLFRNSKIKNQRSKI